MKITWLGQSGFLFDSGNIKVLIDPYLSDSVEKISPQKRRRLPIDESFFNIKPDVMIFTHDHLDHFDPCTASRFLSETEKQITVLSPSSVWEKIRKYENEHNYVQFNQGTEWTAGDLRFTAVYAEHSDPYAIGVIIEELITEKCYYITGDTLYNRRIFDCLPTRIDVIFLPVNGVGNNMNIADASRLAKAVNADIAIPTHFGMFDELDPCGMEHGHCIIPTPYEKFIL